MEALGKGDKGLILQILTSPSLAIRNVQDNNIDHYVQRLDELKDFKQVRHLLRQYMYWWFYLNLQSLWRHRSFDVPKWRQGNIKMPCCICSYGFFLCHKDAQVVFVLILEILNFMFFSFQGKIFLIIILSNENSRSWVHYHIWKYRFTILQNAVVLLWNVVFVVLYCAYFFFFT